MGVDSVSRGHHALRSTLGVPPRRYKEATSALGVMLMKIAGHASLFNWL
jgi:hypothetical protein